MQAQILQPLEITYHPREGDPSTVKWAGVKFEANVPKVVSHPEIIMGAPTNPWFSVKGETAESGEAKRRGPKPKPKTPEAYRAWAVEWINAVKPDPLLEPAIAAAGAVAAMKERWGAEESLREQCGVGSDDLDMLASIFNPKMFSLGGK